MIKQKYFYVFLLWLISMCAGYAQDTINKNISRDREMQARLENYVQLMSSRKDSEKGGGKLNMWVMPVLSFHPSQLSYGLMIGAMKRTGGYLKVKYSFSKVSSDSFECDDEGVSKEDGQERWYTGRTQKSRMAVTGGVVQQVWQPVYLYAGVGYGNRTQVWETVSGSWGKNKDHSFSGVEAEIGGIVALGHVVFSLGMQTNSFKYLEGNVGVGVIF